MNTEYLPTRQHIKKFITQYHNNTDIECLESFIQDAVLSYIPLTVLLNISIIGNKTIEHIYNKSIDNIKCECDFYLQQANLIASEYNFYIDDLINLLELYNNNSNKYFFKRIVRKENNRKKRNSIIKHFYQFKKYI